MIKKNVNKITTLLAVSGSDYLFIHTVVDLEPVTEFKRIDAIKTMNKKKRVKSPLLAPLFYPFAFIYNNRYTVDLNYFNY